MKRNIGKLIVLCSLAIVTLFSCNEDKGGTSGSYDIYKESSSGAPVKCGSIDIKFYDSDIPYVNVSNYLSLFNPDAYSITNNGNVYTFTNQRWANKGKYACDAKFDVDNGILTYDDYTVFTSTSWAAANPLDLNSSLGEFETSEGWTYAPFKVEESVYTHDSSDKTIVNLKTTYNINSYSENNKLYLPLYTTKALFNQHGIGTFFNKNGLYIEGDIGNTESTYDKQIKKNLITPSSTYLEYCYNELCLELDLLFGMKGITRKSRATSGKQITYSFGLNNGDSLAKKSLQSYHSQFVKSPTECDKATYKIYHDLLDDGGHTALIRNSYYSKYTIIPDESVGNEYYRTSEAMSSISKAASRPQQSTYYKKYDSTKGYTGILVLNSFEDLQYDFGAICDLCYSLNEYNGVDRNSVKHLIVDLSTNGGGLVLLQYMLTYFLTRGNVNYASYVNSATNGSKGYVKLTPNILPNRYPQYKKEENILSSKVETIDIICSNATFSAANATACLTQKYGTNVYIDGENAGGGACTVMGSVLSPLGQYAQWSSPTRMCYLENDKYIDDDSGVDTSSSKMRCSWSSKTQPANFSNYSLIISKF